MKLGPHIIQLTGAAQEWARHAPLFKRLDAPAPVVRRFWPDDEQNRRIAQMEVGQTVSDILAVTGEDTEWVEVFNEVAQRQGSHADGEPGLEQHADFIAAIVPELHAHGLKVAAFSFSTGNPGCAAFGDNDDFRYLFNRGWCGADAIALHCYWGPNGLDEYNALRYRALVRGLPRPWPRILITECGRDAVDGGGRGWQASGLTAEQYLDELAAFNAEIEKDDAVIAAFPFTAGPTRDWQAYSTDRLDTRRFYITVNQEIAVALNPPYSPPSTEEQSQNAQLAQNAAQIKDLTDLIEAIRTGRWTGPGSVDGIYCALRGGIPTPDYQPTWPPADFLSPS